MPHSECICTYLNTDKKYTRAAALFLCVPVAAAKGLFHFSDKSIEKMIERCGGILLFLCHYIEASATYGAARI
jgi:hypothetical protein